MKYKIVNNIYLKYIILTISIAFLIYGVINEEHLVVLRKAVNICLECIGIG